MTHTSTDILGTLEEVEKMIKSRIINTGESRVKASAYVIDYLKGRFKDGK